MNAELKLAPEARIYVLEEIQSLTLALEQPLYRNYPGMKLGQRDQIEFFSQRLAVLAAQAIHSQNPPCPDWVITSPAYHQLPSAANLLARQVTQLLQRQGLPVTLVEMRLSGQQMPIHSQEEFKRIRDYSKNSLQQRIEQRQREQLPLNADELAAQFKNRPVLIVNDINVTGTQQKFLQQTLAQFQACACHWLYIFNVEKNLAAQHPEVESRINNSQFNDLESYARILSDRKTQHTAICISRLFGLELDVFRHLLTLLPAGVPQHLYQIILRDCRYNSPLFQEKMTLLSQAPQADTASPGPQITATPHSTRYALDYQIPLIDLHQTRKPHFQIPFDVESPLFNEPLVNLKDYDVPFFSWFAVTDGSNTPYCQPIPGSRPEGWLRKSVAEKLERANRRLAPFNREVIGLDAYRPIACQYGIWHFFIDQGRKKNPQASADELRQYALQYARDPHIFDPKESRNTPIHATGAAIDVVLRQRDTGQWMNMGSKFEEITEVSSTDYFERQLLQGLIDTDDERLWNRRLMHWAMTAEGFLNDPILYWHYDWGNQIWIKVNNVLNPDAPKAAWYGYIPPPQWGVAETPFPPDQQNTV